MTNPDFKLHARVVLNQRGKPQPGTIRGRIFSVPIRYDVHTSDGLIFNVPATDLELAC